MFACSLVTHFMFFNVNVFRCGEYARSFAFTVEIWIENRIGVQVRMLDYRYFVFGKFSNVFGMFKLHVTNRF